MLTLKGEKVYLRALEPDDLDFLYSVENDEEFWEVSCNSTPYSRFVLGQYLENAHKDLYEVKQLRLVICEAGDDSPAGFIDLFDFDPKHRRAALGIIVINKNSRKKGFGFEALQLMCKYSFTHLGLHQVYAHVGADNTSSKLLFEKAGFVCTGQKKDWIRVNGTYKDELIYQLIDKNVH
ncbi:GNAT family N-acetyltransferase [Salinimicrobium soli]|uniref:GNAT family N-acetyltransferase n=1 Tax=Salinimicrobium soli TaxID=1254399 RepID=UPI003AAE46DA